MFSPRLHPAKVSPRQRKRFRSRILSPLLTFSRSARTHTTPPAEIAPGRGARARAQRVSLALSLAGSHATNPESPSSLSPHLVDCPHFRLKPEQKCPSPMSESAKDPEVSNEERPVLLPQPRVARMPFFDRFAREYSLCCLAGCCASARISCAIRPIIALIDANIIATLAHYLVVHPSKSLLLLQPCINII